MQLALPRTLICTTTFTCEIDRLLFFNFFFLLPWRLDRLLVADIDIDVYLLNRLPILPNSRKLLKSRRLD